MLGTYVFQHSYRNKGITLRADIAVIILDEFDPVIESDFHRAPPGPQDLFMRVAHGPYQRAIIFRHVHGQRAPSAYNVYDTLAGLQIDLPADVIHLFD